MPLRTWTVYEKRWIDFMHVGKAYLYPDCMKLRILKLRILNCMLLKYILYLVLLSHVYCDLHIHMSLTLLGDILRYLIALLLCWWICAGNRQDLDERCACANFYVITSDHPFTLLSWPSSLDIVIIYLFKEYLWTTQDWWSFLLCTLLWFTS